MNPCTETETTGAPTPIANMSLTLNAAAQPGRLTGGDYT